MKKFIIGMFSLFLVVGLQAQSSKDVLKNAEKALKPFFKDMAGNADLAKTTLTDLAANFGTPEKPDTYIKLGNLYFKITEEEEKASLLNPAYVAIIPDAGLKASDAYMMAINTKKEKDALKQLDKVMGSLVISANNQFNNKLYTESFKNAEKAFEIHGLLKEKGKDSSLDDVAKMNEQTFYALVAGFYSEDIGSDATNPLAKQLIDAKYDHPFPYEALFNGLKESDVAGAEAALQQGRTAFPDDTGLLYAEINYFLTKGELEKPINNIKQAIEKEPENISLYTTLGNVYDQLNQKKREAGEIEEADKYLAESETYFKQAIEMDTENFDANYSMGALFYNKAATYTEVINELANDYSAEGTKKYDAKKAEMLDLFKLAQPYFEKAHSINPESRNAIIALKEIFARLGDFEKSNEMKAKLEAIGG